MPGCAPTGKAAARNRQAIVLARLHHAQAADGVVAAQNHHLHALLTIAIKTQQFLHQRKRHTRFGWHIQLLLLQCHISLVVAADKDRVFLLKIEQRTRGDSDN